MNELAFFEKYCSHFSNQDVKAIGDCFSGPVTFYLSDGDNYTFSSREEMDSNTEKLLDIYTELGFSRADFNLLAIIQLAKAQHLCQLKWILLDEMSNPIVSFETAYLLSGEPETYSISAVYTNNEMEKLEAVRIDKIKKD